MQESVQYFPSFLQDTSPVFIFFLEHPLIQAPLHCKEDPIYLIPEMKLCGLIPISFIHVSVSELYIPTIGPPILCSKIGGPMVVEYIN